jgi:hypothetical protein
MTMPTGKDPLGLISKPNGSGILTETQRQVIFARKQTHQRVTGDLVVPKLLFQVPIWRPTWRRFGSDQQTFRCVVNDQVEIRTHNQYDPSFYANGTSRLGTLEMDVITAIAYEATKQDQINFRIGTQSLLGVMGLGAHEKYPFGRLRQAIHKLQNTDFFITDLRLLDHLPKEQVVQRFRIVEDFDLASNGRQPLGFGVSLSQSFLAAIKENGSFFFASGLEYSNIARKTKNRNPTAKMLYYLLRSATIRNSFTLHSDLLKLLGEWDQSKSSYRHKNPLDGGRTKSALDVLVGLGIVKTINHDPLNQIICGKMGNPDQMALLPPIQQTTLNLDVSHDGWKPSKVE